MYRFIIYYTTQKNGPAIYLCIMSRTLDDDETTERVVVVLKDRLLGQKALIILHIDYTCGDDTGGSIWTSTKLTKQTSF